MRIPNFDYWKNGVMAAAAKQLPVQDPIMQAQAFMQLAEACCVVANGLINSARLDDKG